MKLLCCIIFSFFFLINFDNVLAESYDVYAKYTVTYNVKAYSSIIDNNEVEIALENDTLVFSSNSSNIKVTIIKMENSANDYAKSITKEENNYYIEFRDSNNKKIIDKQIKVKIKNDNKILHLFDKDGEMIGKSNDFISVSTNDYIFSIKDKLQLNEENFLILDENTDISEIADIDIVNATDVSIYNTDGEKISESQNLGTGYKIIIKYELRKDIINVVVRGDTTGDSKINLNDVTRLYHYYKNIEEMDEPYILAGDVAKNDIINLNDITKIYHYYKKIINSL